jgi:hypothetical protein
MKTFSFIFLIITSVHCYAVSDSLIVSSFCQGSANNCASVALIKAAMLKYGYKDIFTLKKVENSYNITLRDNTHMVITEKERLLATKYSHFETTESYEQLGAEKEEVLFYANLAYACIAKYIQTNGYTGCADYLGVTPDVSRIPEFENALIFITRTSYCTDNCYKYLGLKIRGGIQNYKSGLTLNEMGTILYSWGHAVVVYHNKIDCHGDWVPASTSKICYNYFKWYIVLDK